MIDYPPRVSIITPAYNAERFLFVAVDSVLAQTFQNWELIVINDGSTDGTREYLDTLKDQRIRVFHQTNGGVSSARNVGLDNAHGEFITFLDADDALPQESLAVRVSYLDANPEVAIVDGRVTVKDRALDVAFRERSGGASGPYFPRLVRLDPSVFFNVAVMVRRSMLGGARFRVGLSHCEDLLFFLEASNSKDWMYGAVNESIYWYRTGAQSAMSNLAGLEKGYMYLFEACSRFKGVGTEELDHQSKQIRRILFRSWLRRGNLLRALGAWRNLSRLRQHLMSVRLPGLIS